MGGWMKTVEEVQIALLAYLKAQASLVTLLTVSNNIKETQWQGTDFVYPAVRVGNDVLPSQDGCKPDEVEGAILCFSEQKSSKQCSQIASEVSKILHRLSFTSPVNSVKFMRIYVTRVTYPSQVEGTTIWQSQVQITAQVS
jgi:hypothetical protein